MNTHTALRTPASSIWVLVADGKQARLYVYSKTDVILPMHAPTPLAFAKNKTEEELLPLPDVTLIAEVEAPTAPVKENEELTQKFIKTINLKLKHAYTKKYFSKLVIVASPHALGDLKEHFDSDIAHCIMAELPKEIPHCGTKELLSHIKPTLDRADILAA